jgi:hypothetical protein
MTEEGMVSVNGHYIYYGKSGSDLIQSLLTEASLAAFTGLNSIVSSHLLL